MARATAAAEGLKSEGLREALREALAGRPTALEDLLSRHGAAQGGRPNLRLAAAFGAETAALSGPAALALLARLGANDAAPDTPEVFLPVAAAHGWVARLRAGRDVEEAWAALPELAADERVPVRLGTLDALVTYGASGASGDGGAGAGGSASRRGGGGGRDRRDAAAPAAILVARATGWLDDDDRERRLGVAALVLEVLGDRRVLATVTDHQTVLDYLSRAADEVAGAPRSAERSDARRRVLLSIPRTFAAVVSRWSAGDIGAAWLEAECVRARHPDLRAALSDAVVRLQDTGRGQSAGAAVSERLRRALQGSAKPPRDPTRIRPGLGRGKASRPIR